MKLQRILLSILIGLLAVGPAPAAWAADAGQDTSTATSASQDTPAQPPVVDAPPPGSGSADPAITPPVVTDPVPPATAAVSPAAPVSEPTAPKYIYNEQTGLWESSDYTWNPATGQSSPKNDPGYYYNPATRTWDTNEYAYQPNTGRYEPVVPPQPTVTSQTDTASPVTAAASPLAAPLASSPLAVLSRLFDVGNTNTGPGSTNTAEQTTTGTGFFDLFTKAVVTNNMLSSAHSGDATVSGNLTGGNATTGTASVLANFLNLLNSAWSWAAGGFDVLVSNLFGDHTGDMLLDPGTVANSTPTGGGSIGNANTGPNSTNTATGTSANDLTVRAQTDGAILNNIDLLAQSGNAAVNGNTQAGNAASGDALAQLNIINLINSAIGAGHSFLGLLNIFGNLNGDILFPAGFLDSLTAIGPSGGNSAANTNTGPDSTNTATSTSSADTNVTNQVNTGIANNVNLAAASGAANVDHNTAAGDATTGTAKTQYNLANLTGLNMIGQNGILVLVNVLGHWIGGIMHLPGLGSSQSALLTGGTVSNQNTGPGSNNTANSSASDTANITQQTNAGITNNVHAGALSGDATVSDNTQAGNAASGDAGVVASIANVVDSTLNFSNLFGVLVINVFGNWFGSVNQNTSAGDPPSLPDPGDVHALATVQVVIAPPASVQVHQSGQTSMSSGGGTTGGSSTNVSTDTHSLLATAVSANTAGPVLQDMYRAQSAAASSPRTWLFVLALFFLALSAVIALAQRRVKPGA